MPNATAITDIAPQAQRVIGWLIRDGFEITVVTNAVNQSAG